MAVAWLVVLGGAVAVARSGADDGVGQLTAPSAVAEVPPARPTAAPSPAASSPLEDSVLVLQVPRPAGGAITTHDLVVSGYLVDGTGPVSAIITTSEGERIAARTVGPLTIGRPDDDPNPRFLITVPLGDQRPVGEVRLRVVVYDIDGVPVEVVRRRVVIGPLERREIGEDGLVGGIVFPDP
ncbi:MAG: hypothetical protein WEC14_10165 [Chloroflexota bacterium]